MSWPMKRLMLCCYEVPGYGGASTAGYDLFQRMLSDGIDAQFVNLIDPRDRDFPGFIMSRSLSRAARNRNSSA
jgi:hypothetical protein